MVCASFQLVNAAALLDTLDPPAETAALVLLGRPRLQRLPPGAFQQSMHA